jgi:hypothetical protein
MVKGKVERGDYERGEPTANPKRVMTKVRAR